VSLLQRLAGLDTGQSTRTPRFYTQRSFHWQLDLDSSGAPLSDELLDLTDPEDKARRFGVTHAAPAIRRSFGHVPLLGADDIQYILGWADKKTKPTRAAACLAGFVAAVDRWFGEYPEDSAATALRAFYAEGRHATIRQPERWTSKDGVVITVDGVPVIETRSLQQTWVRMVEARKGGDDGPGTGQCIVCGSHGQLLNRLPQGLPKSLVPGATNDPALVSVNEPIFGHVFAIDLGSSPICIDCGDRSVVNLRTLAESGDTRTATPGSRRRFGSLHVRGQQTRLVWWVVGERDFSGIDLLQTLDAEELGRLLRSVVLSGTAPHAVLDASRFCALTISGSFSRVVVRDWIDRPLRDIEANIRDWFIDHEITPAFPNRPTHQSLFRFVLALGRWQADENAYSPLPKAGKNDPHRPPDVQRGLLEAALRRRTLPPSLMAHLVIRIRTDQHLDDPRAALLRLALSRTHPTSPEEVIVPRPGLDESLDDPAYLAGRLMAVLGSIQYAASRRPADDNGHGPNTTFEDRYLAGAIGNPGVAIVQGRQQAVAWLKKLRRDRPGAAVRLEHALSDLFDRFEAVRGMPGRTSIAEQARFILGYHQQRSHDIRAALAAGSTDVVDVPGIEQPSVDSHRKHQDQSSSTPGVPDE
jgi:CRISPR-associated protein Csd1